MVLMEAIRRRKHVYGAKPLTHNLFEARTVREAARAAGIATQMSVQTSIFALGVQTPRPA